ncbi:MAG TPA: VOC family protein [Terriglobales bacterium]|nr:VOC family protein [Terriglobales bacterium]
MLNAARVIAFVPSRDLDRAKAFYVEVLGLKFVSQDPFALVLNINGNMLRIAKAGDFQPADFTILGFDVADIGAEVAQLRERGIVFERYPGMEQDGMGIWRSPNGARVAWFKDADSNVLSLTEFPVTG